MVISGEEPKLSNDEIVRRRDEALRRALNTPPQPKPSPNPKPVKPVAATTAGKHGQAGEAS